MTIAKQEALTRILDKLVKQLESEGKKVTPEKIVEAGQSVMRDQIYREYPAFDPNVTEALLLIYANFCSELFATIDNSSGVDMDAFAKQIVDEMQRFGKALDKTIKTLASV
jgi:hypothetical protein